MAEFLHREETHRLIWQFILSLAHKSSCGSLADTSFFGKAPEDWRTPRRFADFRNHRVARSVLDCGGPPPLFSAAYLAAAKLRLGLLVNFGGDSLEWKRVIL